MAFMATNDAAYSMVVVQGAIVSNEDSPFDAAHPWTWLQPLVEYSESEDEDEDEGSTEDEESDEDEGVDAAADAGPVD